MKFVFVRSLILGLIVAFWNNSGILLDPRSRGIAQVFLTTWNLYQEDSIFLKMDSEWNIVGNGRRGRGGAYATRGGQRGGPQFRSSGPAKPATKRQRRSTGSTTSVADQSKQDSLSDSPEITSLLQKFKSMNNDEKLESIFLCLHDVKSTSQRLLRAEETVRDIRDCTNQNTRRLNILAYKSIDSEARQRRNNLIFWGIPENLAEDPAVVLSEFMSDKLDLDPVAICVQRVHRLGKLRQPRRQGFGRPTVNYRPLIAAFRDYQDVELILSNASKLKGSSFSINKDYPREIVDARKILFRKKREIKSEKPDSNVTIKYPAKLVVDGLTVKDMFPDWFPTLKKSRLFTAQESSTLTTEEDSADESDMEQGIVSDASSNDARQHSTLRASRMDIPRTTSRMSTDTVTRSCSMAARITYQDDSSAPSKKPPDTTANQNA